MPFVDPIVDNYRTRGYMVMFETLNSRAPFKTIAFDAFLTEFSNNFSSNWNPETVYGRQDPIFTFQNTSRTISFSLDVPATHAEDAQLNLEKARYLTRFLYPEYESRAYATTISRSPLIRIKFLNLIGKGYNSNSDPGASPFGPSSPTMQGGALLGKLDGLSITHIVEYGYFDTETLYPKVFKISCKFDVLHEESISLLGEQGHRISSPGHGELPEDEEESPPSAATDQDEADLDNLTSGDPLPPDPLDPFPPTIDPVTGQPLDY